MRKINRYLRGMVAAWDMLVDYPLPAALVTRFNPGVDSTSKLAGFALCGALSGLAIVLVYEFSVRAFNQVAGCILFALLSLLFLELKDSGRGTGLFTSLVLARKSGYSWEDSLALIHADWNRLSVGGAAIFVTLLELCKAALLFTLAFHGAKLWIVVILTGAFAVQGLLATEADFTTGRPMLAVPPENRRAGWWSVGVVYFLLLARFSVGIIAAGAIVYFAATGLAGYFKRNFGGVSSDFITLAGSGMELALLLAGILFALTT